MTSERVSLAKLSDRTDYTSTALIKTEQISSGCERVETCK